MSTIPIDDYEGWAEPESAANEDFPPKYPYNKATRTPSGHLIEVDDTPDGERVRVTHRTGSFIEMGPDGSVVHKTIGDDYRVTLGNKNIEVSGFCNITINGDALVNVKGDKYEKVEGDYNVEVLGELTLRSHKQVNVLSNEDVKIGAGSGVLSTGAVYMTASDKVYVTGDFHAGGEIIGDIITSITRVDAGTGVSAGPLGFVSILGGLSIGVPIAVPGNITTIGMVNAGISVNSPMGNFLLSDSVLMTDIVNTTLHNIHFHVGFKGPTSPPIPDMI